MAEQKKRAISLVIPEELDQKIIELKKTDRFVRSSYAEIVRQLLLSGIQKTKEDRK